MFQNKKKNEGEKRENLLFELFSAYPSRLSIQEAIFTHPIRVTCVTFSS